MRSRKRPALESAAVGVLLQVSARAERLVSSARQHDRAAGFILDGLRDALADRPYHFLIERVPAFRAVDRDPLHRAAPMD